MLSQVTNYIWTIFSNNLHNNDIIKVLYYVLRITNSNSKFIG